MNEVPTMVSTKDLSYIEDMLNWNFTTIKKINAYVNKINDNDVKETLIYVIEKYKNHYQTILQCLNIGGNNEQQNIQS